MTDENFVVAKQLLDDNTLAPNVITSQSLYNDKADLGQIEYNMISKEILFAQAGV